MYIKNNVLFIFIRGEKFIACVREKQKYLNNIVSKDIFLFVDKLKKIIQHNKNEKNYKHRQTFYEKWWIEYSLKVIHINILKIILYC